MSLLPKGCDGRLRWLAWSAFWLGIASLGDMQTWVFGDHANTPALADVVEPIHFWFPMVLLIAPVSEPGASSIGTASLLLLSGVVVAAWLHLAIGSVVIAGRWLNRRAHDISTPPTSFPPL